MSTNTALVPVGPHQVPAEVYEAVKRQLIASLGDGELFWIHEGGQHKRAFKARVGLDCPVHFCWPAGARAKPMITGEGFDRLNQFASIEIFRPKTLIGAEGREVGNPFFERDQHGAMLSCTMRGIGIGYGPTGNLVAVDQTVYVHLQTLLIQELQAKLKKHPHLGTMGSADQRPATVQFYKDNGERGHKRVIDATPTTIEAVGYWHFVPFANGIGYWVNLSHPEIQAAFDSFAQKQRFLERSTFTILRRLILSSHPAIASKTPVVVEQGPEQYGKIESGKGYVFVYGFKPEDGSAEARRRDLAAMAERVAEGERVGNLEIKQGGLHDAAQEEEIANLEGADPSELPPEPEDDEGPATVAAAPPPPPPPPPPPAPAEPPAAPPPPPAAPATTAGKPPVRKAAPAVSSAMAALNAFLGNAEGDIRAKADEIRDELGYKMFSALRLAGDDKIAAFLAACEAAGILAPAAA